MSPDPNDALLMFCLRHYGQDAGGKRTVINYFSTRAGAGVVAGSGEGAGASGAGADGAGMAGAVAEASTTTVRTVIHGGAAAGAGDAAGAQDAAARRIEGFEGVALDEQAKAEIDAALIALAERQRALIAATDEGGPEGIEAQLDDPGVELVQLGERGIPFYGPLQAFEGLADAGPARRFAGEADWVEAGGDIPEAYRAWIEAAEARGEAVPAVPLAPAMAGDGVAAVKKRLSWRQARKRKAAKGGEGTE